MSKPKTAVMMIYEINAAVGVWEYTLKQARANVEQFLKTIPGLSKEKTATFVKRFMEEFQLLIPQLDEIITTEQLKHLSLEDLRAFHRWTLSPIGLRCAKSAFITNVATQPIIMEKCMRIAQHLAEEILNSQKPASSSPANA
jgi:hypothetical protein